MVNITIWTKHHIRIPQGSKPNVSAQFELKLDDRLTLHQMVTLDRKGVVNLTASVQQQCNFMTKF